MDYKTRKKLRFILIGFFIAMIPLGYWIFSSLIFEKANKAYNDAISSEDKEQIETSIKEVEKALKIIPWSRFLKSCKYTLYYQIGEYQKALSYAKKRDDYDFICMIYEKMNKPDSAKIFYYKKIDELKSTLSKEENEFMILLKGRELALLHTFVGDSVGALSYLTDLSKTDYSTREFMLRYDYYIENYISGGYNDFLVGETVKMINTSHYDKVGMDSLIDVNRFYYNNYSVVRYSDQDAKATYEFKKIFKTKAKAIGFKEITGDRR